MSALASGRARLAFAALPYVLILCAQLLTTTAAWWQDDLPGLDTACAYATAVGWRDGTNTIDLHLSPGYSVLLAAWLEVSKDPLEVLPLHRLFIVLVNTGLVLAIFRRLMPAIPAWLMALWWVLIPESHDTRYAVHLYGLTPWLLGMYGFAVGSRRARGLGLAALLGGALLFRTELLAPFLLLGAALGIAAWRRRGTGPPVSATRRLVPYVLPAVVVLVLAAAVVLASGEDLATAREGLDHKARDSASVMYAVGAKQRAPERMESPFHEKGAYVEPVFGASPIGFPEMVRRNPGAAWSHVRWNLGLVPAGLQRLLLGRWDGAHDPDFDGGHRHKSAPLYLALLCAAWLVMGVLAWRRRALLRRYVRRSGTWGWIALLATVPGTCAVMLAYRPAAVYLLPLAVVLMACTGIGLRLALPRPRFRPPRHLVAVALVTLVGVLAFRELDTHPEAEPPRARAYRILAAHPTLVQDAGQTFLVDPIAQEVFPYVRPREDTRLAPVPDIDPGQDVWPQLEAAGVRTVLLGPGLRYRWGLDEKAWRQHVIEAPGRAAWRALPLPPPRSRSSEFGLWVKHAASGGG